ncbi:MAG: helicase-related protein [Xanthomonadaceae bacterium]|nr:helicase-related protein [Xanthomonadaceae bacterium]
MKLPDSLNLHVAGRLSEVDAKRQARSAQVILERFGTQPGVILGDEVGMGKTFVALAVSASLVVLDPSRPVVIMVPRGVVRKWERDSNTFRSECLRDDSERTRFRVKVAETGIDFLKLLDDPAERSPATVIVLAHGALHGRLADNWAKLALLQAAIKGRHGADQLRERLARYASKVLRMGPRVTAELVLRLLRSPTTEWKRYIVKQGLMSESDDDPVPQLFVDTVEKLDLSDVYARVLKVIPTRGSKYLNERLRTARNALNHPGDGVLPPIWREVLRKMNLSLPLLVLDEAHRVRHGGTQLAKLLAQHREGLDAASGQLAHRFERMLFLTATPFQLGHAELCNVLSRFEAVAWKSHRAAAMGREVFTDAIRDLRAKLDAMQLATDRLERAWKRLLVPDLDEAISGHGETWWTEGERADNAECSSVANERVRGVMLAYRDAHEAIRLAEQRLRQWVLRSSRSPCLPPPFDRTPRRERVEGAAVMSEILESAPMLAGGLRVTGANALPFLLAARLGTLGCAHRVFCDGIASSYEALTETRREADTVAPADAETGDRLQGTWHLARLRESVQAIGARGRALHPKVRATIDLAMTLWRRGEKVLIFCHYRQTGRALHRYLSEAMLEEIECRAAEQLRCPRDEVPNAMRRFIDRLDRDRATDVIELLDAMLSCHPELQVPKLRTSIHDIVLRFLRTPTFLVRFADLTVDRIPGGWIDSMFDSPDSSGQTLREVLRKFLDFLAVRCGAEERDAYLDALSRVQTGSHAGAEVEASFDEDEAQVGERSRLVANVRRVYGDTRDQTRDRIMLTFNTPFYPEILIASSVMAEGVDLHLNCRHVIHHDLDWNPSSLEQRTGRVDRLGSKAERSGRSIKVYLPYVEGCQDEKLFRVVMDREQWFGVVMGADESMSRMLSASAWEVERMAEQPLIPTAMVDALKLRLGVDE